MVRHHCGYDQKPIYSGITAIIYTTWIQGMDTLADTISQAEPFMLHIYASLAQKERELISHRCIGSGEGEGGAKSGSSRCHGACGTSI